MDSFLLSVLSNLASALVGAVIGAVAAWTGPRILERHPMRQLLDLPEGPVYAVLGTPAYMAPGSATTIMERRVPVATIGTIFAYQHMANLYARAYPKRPEMELYFSTDFPHQLYTGNLILLGFPLSNEVTAAVMNRLQLPMKFDGHAIIDTKTNKPPYRAKTDGDFVTEDYGCITRVRNPFNEDAVVFIFGGSETFGVKAAADYLMLKNLLELSGIHPPKIIRWFLRRLAFLIPKRWRAQEYQVLVHSYVNRYTTTRPKKEAYYRL